ncbi:hypothetical protein BHM03_00048880 [Ensete ventricosum]|nr:hypothetical protein BHM03_00048880 [Ensete ventricosum]
MLSYFVAASVVLATRRAACFLPLGNVGLAPLTPVRSVVPRLTLSCLCQASSTHVGSATSLGQLSSVGSARAELPKQVVDRYKESVGFKEGLKRMGRVTYEYGYRVALARFHALHPDSEVEEDPFTIHPEDDLVPMKRQQAFDDSDPPES